MIEQGHENTAFFKGLTLFRGRISESLLKNNIVWKEVKFKSKMSMRTNDAIESNSHLLPLTP